MDENVEDGDLFKKLASLDVSYLCKSLPVRNFADNYNNLLPIIARVADGYCSYNEHDFNFSSEEMYIISHLLHQKRVVLQDESGQLLSFPEDHPLRFVEIDRKLGTVTDTPKTLVKLLQSEDFAKYGTLLIEVHKDGTTDVIRFYAGADEDIATTASSLGVLKIVDVYDEKYLVGNAILDDTINETPTIIPLWLRITVHVVDGIRNETHQAFQQFVKDLCISCSAERNKNTKGNKEIMVFEGKLSDYAEGYDTIRLSSYNACQKQVRQKQKPYVNVIAEVTDLPEQPPKRPPKYENVLRTPVPLNSNKPLFTVQGTRTMKFAEEINPLPEPKLPKLRIPPRGINQSNMFATGKAESVPRYPVRQYSQGSRHIVRQYSDDPGLYGQNNQPNPSNLHSTAHSRSRLVYSRNKSCDESLNELKEEIQSEQPTLNIRESESTQPIYARHSDVQKPVDEMSVSEIVEVLRLLKLSRHIDRFQEEDVDGSLLSQVNEQILIENFEFSQFEAKKLKLFQKGWRVKHKE